MSWTKAQSFESEWWGNCTNTLGEEIKQLTYARLMGLEFFHDSKSPYNIDIKGRSVIDIGGGPASLLLKCVNRGTCAVVDPLKTPLWVKERYREANISFINDKAEDVSNTPSDEIWIYNCLQHTDNPRKIIKKAKEAAMVIRICEWIDTGINDGHPHSLNEKDLNKWLGGEGKVEVLKESMLRGKIYYGVFPS